MYYGNLQVKMLKQRAQFAIVYEQGNYQFNCFSWRQVTCTSLILSHAAISKTS